MLRHHNKPPTQRCRKCKVILPGRDFWTVPYSKKRHKNCRRCRSRRKAELKKRLRLAEARREERRLARAKWKADAPLRQEEAIQRKKAERMQKEKDLQALGESMYPGEKVPKSVLKYLYKALEGG